MAITLPTFTPLEDSLWLTLCARALDQRRPHPILGDTMADQRDGPGLAGRHPHRPGRR